MTMNNRRNPHEPWFALAVAVLGVVVLWILAAGWHDIAQPVVADRPTIQLIVTVPPWPTPIPLPTATPTSTPYPTYRPRPTATTPPYYDPRWATPGRIYLVPPPPPPTPTPYPICSADLRPGTWCIAPAASPIATPVFP